MYEKHCSKEEGQGGQKLVFLEENSLFAQIKKNIINI